MNRYANHGGAKNAAMINVAWLVDFENGAIRTIGGLRAIHSLMQMRIEGLAMGFDALRAKPRKIIEKLLINQLKPFAIAFVLIFTMSGKGMLKAVDHRYELLDYTSGSALASFAIVFLGAFAEICEIGLMAH